MEPITAFAAFLAVFAAGTFVDILGKAKDGFNAEMRKQEREELRKKKAKLAKKQAKLSKKRARR